MRKSASIKNSPRKFSIPTLSFKSTPINAYLVGALVIFSFVLGMLTNKVISLESANKIITNQTAVAQTTPIPSPQPTLSPYTKVKDGHFPVKGLGNAKISVVEFADIRCPFCKAFFTDTEQQLIDQYVNTGKVKFAFRHWAFLGAASTVAANAVECANEQGKFWDFHDYLYKNQPPESDTSMYTIDNMAQVAGNLGLDSTQFSNCLTASKYQKNVDSDKADGDKAGVGATPTFFINGFRLVGAQPFSEFKKIIDLELKK